MAKKPYGIAAYESAQRTVPQLQAVVLLYDGMLRRLKGAAHAAQAGDIKLQIEESLQAVRVLEGLNRCLDMEKGGQVAENLRETYTAVANTLARAIGQPAGADACEKLFSAVAILRDAWAEIAGLAPLDSSSEKEESNVGA